MSQTLKQGQVAHLHWRESSQVALWGKGKENRGCVCSKVLAWWAIK